MGAKIICDLFTQQPRRRKRHATRSFLLWVDCPGRRVRWSATTWGVWARCGARRSCGSAARGLWRPRWGAATPRWTWPGALPGGGFRAPGGCRGCGGPQKARVLRFVSWSFRATCFSPTCRRRRLCRFRTFASGRCFGVLIGTATASFRVRITFGRTPLGVYKQSGEDSKVRRKEDPMAHVYSESVHSQPDATTCLSLNRAYFSRVALFGCLSAFHKLPLLGGQNHSVSFLA